MKAMKTLLEDSFAEKVKSAYEKLQHRTELKPSDFDRDALELGVLYELARVKNFPKALLIAMRKLHDDPHCYDNVDDFGAVQIPAMNQVTWTGQPGTTWNLGYK